MMLDGGGRAMGKRMLRGWQGPGGGGEWEGEVGRVDRKDGGGEGGNGKAETGRGTGKGNLEGERGRRWEGSKEGVGRGRQGGGQQGGDWEGAMGRGRWKGGQWGGGDGEGGGQKRWGWGGGEKRGGGKRGGERGKRRVDFTDGYDGMPGWT